jgi:hypothetical protein
MAESGYDGPAVERMLFRWHVLTMSPLEYPSIISSRKADNILEAEALKNRTL